jgi:hypothetical protein
MLFAGIKAHQARLPKMPRKYKKEMDLPKSIEKIDLPILISALEQKNIGSAWPIHNSLNLSDFYCTPILRTMNAPMLGLGVILLNSWEFFWYYQIWVLGATDFKWKGLSPK